ncbi:hypothetical protein FQN50_008451 [Emmonsiellopsis sp. PD_5]|nr:hypothetical protein FQN50_008451 [Emmonsiellopsis sp. PD_5]
MIDDTAWQYNPVDIPGITETEKCCDALQGRVNAPRITTTRPLGKQDIFATLPEEIFNMIFVLLPSKGVCNLRRASRSARLMPLWLNFWVSRFQHPFEFSWNFEAKRRLTSTPGSCDARGLYMKIKDTIIKAENLELVRSIQNRRRIWTILLPLADALIAIQNAKVEGIRMPSFFEGLLDCQNEYSDVRNSWRTWNPFLRLANIFVGIVRKDAECNPLPPYVLWKFAGGPSIATCYSFARYDFTIGSRFCYSRLVHLSSGFEGAYISTIEVGRRKWVSGIRFELLNGDSCGLGYVLKGQETYIEIPGERYYQGFHLATSERGVHGIALVGSSGKVSPWAGSHEGLPRMRLLAGNLFGESVLGNFDGFKLLNLGLPARSRERHSSFRDDTSWFPEIPPERMILNENSFFRAEPAYEPDYGGTFSFCNFGGPYGSYLKNITSISVWTTPRRRPWLERVATIAFEIHYNILVDGSTTCRFGTDPPLPWDSAGIKHGKPRKRTFYINGPGGEYITAVDVPMPSGFWDGQGFGLYTNFGRSMAFPISPECRRIRDTDAVLEVRGGMRITGIYAKVQDGTMFPGFTTESIYTPAEIMLKVIEFGGLVWWWLFVFYRTCSPDGVAGDKS